MKGYYLPLIFWFSGPQKIGAQSDHVTSFRDGLISQPHVVIREATKAEFLASTEERYGEPPPKGWRKPRGAHFYEVSTD